MKHHLDEWTDYADMVLRIATDYRKRYPMVELEDLIQEQNLWFVSHPRKFKEWLALEQKERDRLVAKSLRNAALKYAEKEKARKGGYDLGDVYYYDVSVVETYLPSIINGSHEMPEKIKDLNSKVTDKGEVSDGMNWLALRADIDKAFNKLSEAKQNVLRIKYTDPKVEWETIAEDMSTTANGARMKVQRALASLVQNLGGWRPFNDKETTEETTDATPETTSQEEYEG
mgnify:FL=1